MEKVNQIIKTLEGFESKARLYWLGVMVKANDLTEREAGYLIINNLGLFE